MCKKTGKISLFLLPLSLLLPAAAPAEVLNQIVLRVNDRIATLYDYQQRREEAVAMITRQVQDPQERQAQLARIGEVVFKEMYQDLLLESRADQLNIEMTPAQLDAEVARRREASGIRTDEEFRVALQQAGLSEEQLRDQIRRDIRMQQVLRTEISGRVQLEEEDLRRYYRKNLEQFRQPEQVNLREVVVLEKEGGLPEDERRRVAAEIRQAVAAGKTLDEAAESHISQGNVSNVIELGWVSPGDLDPNLEAAAWKVAAGAVSEPVPARGGIHLLQVTERRESQILPFNDVAERIRRIEGSRIFREESVKYLEELEKRSLLVADPPADAAGFRRLLSDPAEAAGSPEEGEAAAKGAEGLVNESAPGAPGGQSDPAPGTATPLPPTGTSTGTGTQEPGTLPEPKPVTPTPPPPPPGA